MQLIDPIQPNHPFYSFTAETLDTLVAKGYTEEQINAWIEDRNEGIRLETDDPLNYGHKLPHWADMRNLLREKQECLVMGGNRAGKTIGCVDYVVDTLINGPAWLDGIHRERRKSGLNIACLHSSSKSSIVQQQWEVYKYLPPAIRDMGKMKENKHANVTFSRKTGFSDNMFILPNGNMCLFFNYNQEVGDLEGYEYDLVWCDELVPKGFVEALRFRLATRSGKLIVSFTPVQGFTPTVRMFVAGSVTRETKPADPKLFPELATNGKLPSLVKGCQPGKMPYTADCRDNNGGIIYFHSIMNPFNPYSEIVEKCQGRSTGDIKMRAYGYAERMDSGAFPKFSKAHIMTRDRWLDVQKLPGSRFVVADPGGNKNWFIKWYFCTKDGCAHVYREFPDLQRYGEWAIPSDKLDFKAGPAQRLEAGRGIEGYKQLILEMEGWTWDRDSGVWDGSNAENIEERIMDARFGGDERYGEGTSIINLMEEEQTDSMGKVTGPRMWWNPARGNGAKGGLKPTEIGIQMLNEMMDYNEEQPVNAMNCPRWYVHEDCQQSIYAYQEYTALGTEKDALKDIIDPDRYLVSSDVGFLDKENLQCISGGSY